MIPKTLANEPYCKVFPVYTMILYSFNIHLILYYETFVILAQLSSSLFD